MTAAQTLPKSTRLPNRTNPQRRMALRPALRTTTTVEDHTDAIEIAPQTDLGKNG